MMRSVALAFLFLAVAGAISLALTFPTPENATIAAVILGIFFSNLAALEENQNKRSDFPKVIVEIDPARGCDPIQIEEIVRASVQQPPASLRQ